MTTSNFYYNLYSSVVGCAKKCIKPSSIELIENEFASTAARAAAFVTSLIVGLTPLTTLGADPDLPCLPEHEPVWIVSRTFFILGALTVGLRVAMPRLQKINEALEKWIQPYKDRFVNEEIATFVKKSSSTDKLALVFRPADNKRGDFTTHYEISALQKSTKDHKVTVISASNGAEIQAQTAHAKDIYHKVIIQGHGNSQQIFIGDKTVLTNRSKNTLGWLRDHTHIGATILLLACQTAKGEENIARDISIACPHTTVYASPTSVYPDSTIYDDQGIPSFRLVTDEQGTDPVDVTCTYQNGVLIPTPNNQLS